MSNLYTTLNDLLTKDATKQLLEHLGIEFKRDQFRHNKSISVYSRNGKGFIKDQGGDAFHGDIFQYLESKQGFSKQDALVYVADALNISHDFQSNFTPKQIKITGTVKTAAPEHTQEDINRAETRKSSNIAALTPALALRGLKELYPFIKDVTQHMQYLGWNNYHDTLTFEYPKLSINRRTAKGKWIGERTNKRTHIPYRIDDRSKHVYLYSGMAERIAVEEMGLNFIGLQMDRSDKEITDDIKLAMTGKVLVILEENDKSSQELSQRLRHLFLNVKVIPVGAEKKRGYDFRDFVNDLNSFSAAKSHLEEMVRTTLELNQMVQDEMIIPYTNYIGDNKTVNVGELKRGVIVALTGHGKTYSFDNKPGKLILVPRVLQTDTGKGDDTEYLINKAINVGAKITYEKFIGHYKAVPEFKHLIDSKHIDVIVDECHLIPQLKSGYEIIYGLDAVFMSGTLEKFFRPDLQRYKFKPPEPQTIYYSENGVVPSFENALYFVDKANALMQNYPSQCVVGAEHKFSNVNVHKHLKGRVYATNCLREGISIETDTYEACVISLKECGLWSTKDIIQGSFRVRGYLVMRIVAGELAKEYTKKIDFKWYLEKASELTGTKEINTIMGEEYSKFIKLSHKPSRYLGATEFGVVCYLAEKTKNNYDKDLYCFKPLEGDYKHLDIKTKASPANNVIVAKRYTADNVTYEYPSNRHKAFMNWIRHKESGLVDKFMRMTEFNNFHHLYANSRTSKILKAKYNQMYKKNKYTIDKFYELIRKTVDIEISFKGEVIERVSSKMDFNELHIKVVGECPIKGVNIVDNKTLSNGYEKEDNLRGTITLEEYPLKYCDKAQDIGLNPELVYSSKKEGKKEVKKEGKMTSIITSNVNTKCIHPATVKPPEKLAINDINIIQNKQDIKYKRAMFELRMQLKYESRFMGVSEYLDDGTALVILDNFDSVLEKVS